MKKAVTVNLCGSLFTIDEDAYQLLSNYLESVRAYFHTQQGGDEISQDVEARVTELFAEKQSAGTQSITIEQVQEIIARIGSPQEMQSEDGDEAEPVKPTFIPDPPKEGADRRLYRNPADKMLGGVVSGLAAYMKCNVTLLRLIALVLLFMFPGVSVIVYVILWYFLPEANTTAKRLNMEGIAVTVENIGKSVSQGAARMGKDVNDFISSEQTTSHARKAADGIVKVAGAVLKGALAVFAGLLTVIVFTLLLGIVLDIASIVMVSTVGDGAFLAMIPGAEVEVYHGLSLSWGLVCCLALMLLIAIPLFALSHSIFKEVLGGKKLPQWATISSTIIWFFALMLVFCFFMMALSHEGSLEPPYYIMQITHP